MKCYIVRLSRPPIVAKPEGGKDLEFDPNEWHAAGEEGTDDLGIQVTLIEYLQVLIDELEADKLADEEHSLYVLEKSIKDQPLPVASNESPVKAVDGPEVAAVIETCSVSTIFPIPRCERSRCQIHSAST